MYANAGRLAAFAIIDGTVVCMKNVSQIHRVTDIEGMGHVLEFYTRTGWYYIDSLHRVYVKCDAKDVGSFEVKRIHSYKTEYIKEVFEKSNRIIRTVYERNING